MLDGNISPVANPGGCQAATTCVRAYTAYRGNTSPGAWRRYFRIGHYDHANDAVDHPSLHALMI